MSDETPTTTETASAPAPEAKPEVFSADYVQELRAEAAKYRTDKKEAVEKAKSEVVKTYEGKLSQHDSALSEAQQELSAANLELLKLRAVLAEQIASEDVLDVVSLVQGTDEESVSESVKRVKSLIGKAPERDRPVDSSQGSGSHVPLNGDPILEKVKRMVGA